MDGTPDGEHEEALKSGRACRLPALIELRKAGDVWFPMGFQRQATSSGQSGPTLQPVTHVLVGKSP